jgi:cytidylate kinase
MERIINIAIDGLCGAGKGTIAKELAAYLKYRVLDAGSMYRALAYSLHEIGIMPENVTLQDLNKYTITFDPIEGVLINQQSLERYIRTLEVGEYTAIYGKNQVFKKHILDTQSILVSEKGWVGEGRNMAKDVMPDAELKIYLYASPEIRAERRFKESKKGTTKTMDDVLKELIARDETDYTHKQPLIRPEEAHKHYTIVLNNDKLSLEEQLSMVKGLADKVIYG